MIYLDNAATTKPYDEVIEYMNRADKEFFANPSSMHLAGYSAEKEIAAAKEDFLKLLGAKNHDVIFTSGGTESNNLAIFGSVFHSLKRKPHIITTKIEHPSVLEPFAALEKLGASVTYISPKDTGHISADDVFAAICDNTAFVSVMAVNNETGAINNILEIAKKIKAKNKSILVHTDCVQAYGNTDIAGFLPYVDFVSLSGHKIHGPKGIGALIKSKGARLLPVMLGGHQQNNLRSGTHNTTGILGFCKAATLTKDNKKTALKERLIDNLKDNELFKINNDGDGYSSHIVSISVKNVRAEVLLHALETYGICVSAGSACSSNKPAPSHVLTALGYDKKQIEETIRVSFGAFSSISDVDAFCDAVVREAGTLSKFTRS